MDAIAHEFGTGTELVPALVRALTLACERAETHRGATAPNPPVGAAGMDSQGEILSVQAHARVGEPHAEALLIEELKKSGRLERLQTVVVTLEPCDHYGRTPPCSRALVEIPSLKKVIFAVGDPNPEAKGGGERLASAGIKVENLSLTHPSHPAVQRAHELSRPFVHRLRTGKPWVTVKTVWRRLEDGSLSMIPPSGSKTFSSPESLRFAHSLRKRADALITGSGTVLSDLPEFTVRLLPDHPGKKRHLAVLDRRGRVPEEWLSSKARQGFRVVGRPQTNGDFSALLAYLGEQGALEALLEAGPALSGFVLENSLWDEHVRIVCAFGSGVEAGRARYANKDEIVREFRA